MAKLDPERDFRCSVEPLRASLSNPHWDWECKVVRLHDGATLTEKASGGWLIAEAVCNRLTRELGGDI